MNGWTYFDPSEAGYLELRQLFDFVRERGIIGPRVASSSNSGTTNGVYGATSNGHVEICVVDADDMLDDPYGIIAAYCKSVGIPFSESMLKWSEEDQHRAKLQFEGWKGFHEDAILSNELKPRAHVSSPMIDVHSRTPVSRLNVPREKRAHMPIQKKIPKSDQQLYQEWVEKYGEEAAKTIKKTVDDNIEHYEYLKQFAVKA